MHYMRRMAMDGVLLKFFLKLGGKLGGFSVTPYSNPSENTWLPLTRDRR